MGAKVFLVFLSCLLITVLSMGAASIKICIGTSHRLWYRELKARYANCTHIIGNLEIYRLGNPESQFSLDFLNNLQEITGYLLVHEANEVSITLPSLQIIRGESLLRLNQESPEYAMVVQSWNRISQLRLPALREISRGSVGIFAGNRLCYLETIDWTEIIAEKDAKFQYFWKGDWLSGEYESGSSPDSACARCNSSCEGGCWGTGGEADCQQFSKQNCDIECESGRCFGSTTQECCHPACAGGCTGPHANQCLVCKYVEYGGECRESCPDNMYSLGPTCVETCPEGSLIDEEKNACLAQCPLDKHQYQSGNVCKKLPPSAKKCRALSDIWPSILLNDIEHFRNCTVLEGDIRLLKPGLASEKHNFTHPLQSIAPSTAQLEVLSTLREITGSIFVSFANFTDLSCFRNLEVLGGDLDIYRTSLESLNLSNLRVIHGDVHINENSDLCYLNSINWSALTGARNKTNMKQNGKLDKCKMNGKECSSRCSEDGCWGEGDNQCVCLKYKQEAKCVSSCDVESGYYTDGYNCVKSCPVETYALNGTCIDCHENCMGGCTGPAIFLEKGGCNSCHQAIRHHNDNVTICMNIGQECPQSHYLATSELPEYATLHGIKRLCLHYPNRISTALAIVFGFVFIIFAASLGLLFYWKKVSPGWIPWASESYKSWQSPLINSGNEGVEFGQLSVED